MNIIHDNYQYVETVLKAFGSICIQHNHRNENAADNIYRNDAGTNVEYENVDSFCLVSFKQTEEKIYSNAMKRYSEDVYTEPYDVDGYMKYINAHLLSISLDLPLDDKS